jgi:hypothetical protein
MNRRGWLALGVLTVALAGAACQQPAAEAAAPAIRIEERDSGLDLLTLDAKAAERLGVTTAAVEDRGGRLVVPYAAVIYDADGAAWVYVQGKGLAFERAPITVDEIDGEDALLAAGPPAGRHVVIVGAAELYGAETGVGGGH